MARNRSRSSRLLSDLAVLDKCHATAAGVCRVETISERMRCLETSRDWHHGCIRFASLDQGLACELRGLDMISGRLCNTSVMAVLAAYPFPNPWGHA